MWQSSWTAVCRTSSGSVHLRDWLLLVTQVQHPVLSQLLLLWQFELFSGMKYIHLVNFTMCIVDYEIK